ncbi:sodium:proton antiporter [Methylocapsa aurea]|uniref:sodium:proton antiporter n=1 Tax=Methylocapsa aurea TaxID=663610 RepID=UPI00138E2245|nr:sodium:proton antiporter [Methylocapsa aurea]
MLAFVQKRAVAAQLALMAMVSPAAAADALNGANLPWPLALPFAGILLSIALGPLVVKEWWHIHYEKAAAFWALLTLAGLVAVEGFAAMLAGLAHSIALEYLPFILMLFALFTAAGGISISGKLAGTPLVNSAILGLGAATASIIGTTGASMILIRPLLRANERRRVNAHVVVFFIFLVSNIGGALTPLGDPPLFLGFLLGVDFFWTTKALWPQTLFAVCVLLVIFVLLDSYFYRREKTFGTASSQTGALRVAGLVNIALIAVAIAAIVASGIWRPGLGFDVLGTRIELQNLVREAVMIGVGLASLALTGARARAENGFEWEPIREVAYLFAGIFICIIPVMAMLQAGTDGPFAPVIRLLALADGTPNNPVYFWATGLLSSFLDNAPTYLVFFELAGGDPATLMGPLAKTLTAISLGAVFMGANTYIGNAPNFMVYAIARRAGVKMPGFFPYMLWSGAILLPIFAAITWLFMLSPKTAPKPAEPLQATQDRAKIGDEAGASGQRRTELQAPSVAPKEIENLTGRIAALQGQLAERENALAAAETRNRQLQAQIAARVDAMPAEKVKNLARYRSMFLESLKQSLGGRPEISVIGDRLVLQSDFLFGSRLATLAPAGRGELDRIASAIIDLEKRAPDIAWVARVEGHTDARPIRSKQFPSNLALSAQRASAAAQYLIEKGVSPQRLAIAGFGEYQPRDPNGGDAARRLNRRIEVTIAER